MLGNEERRGKKTKVLSSRVCVSLWDSSCEKVQTENEARRVGSEPPNHAHALDLAFEVHLCAPVRGVSLYFYTLDDLYIYIFCSIMHVLPRDIYTMGGILPGISVAGLGATFAASLSGQEKYQHYSTTEASFFPKA